MNELLQLKGKFFQRSNNSKPGPSNLPKGKHVEIEHLLNLKRQLLDLQEFWNKEKYLNGALISVFYKGVVAKSRRVKSFLSKGNKTANNSIVGAKFTEGDKRKHIITHYIEKEVLNETINRISESIKIISEKFGDKINYYNIEQINKKNINIDKYNIGKNNFVNIIVDSFYVEKFSILEEKEDIIQNSLITIYKTDIDTKELLEKIGIKIFSSRILDETTIFLTPDELKILKNNAPYLIAMAVSDLANYNYEDFFEAQEGEKISIPDPINEPVVGVIDTLFDERVYFSNWVEFIDKTDPNIPIENRDYEHGTEVTSIIVDGPQINPEMDDGCGRFRVKHFGVARATQMSSFSILKAIEEIVSNNKDIHVWNLSLGSSLEINLNFISPEAYYLDKIQFENNVIFVIAGTNKTRDDIERIGAPADSINSLVVNSVNMRGEPATYARKGIVLSFFNKPDISYYGGDKDRYMKVCGPTGEGRVIGTSFAAPWVSRKMAYLIEVLGFSREVAKALLIDSATGWNKQNSNELACLIGYGVIPKRIEEILKTPSDEIKFILSGESEKYDTYNYNIPVPIYGDKHPFIAKATMCYFPNCSRNQGVDYTNTELDIYFGRIGEKGIQSINENIQSIDGEHYLREESARKYYRKWDNVKHIKQIYKEGIRPKKAYGNGMWGVSIKTKERLEKKDGEGIKFGIVVTLKEINRVNRIDEFINLCLLRGWLVNKINVENQIDIYNKAEEEIEFE